MDVQNIVRRCFGKCKIWLFQEVDLYSLKFLRFVKHTVLVQHILRIKLIELKYLELICL
jgi:hypothetical protein